jgi:hypothetical protein
MDCELAEQREQKKDSDKKRKNECTYIHLNISELIHFIKFVTNQ